jgi:putative two-component system response regulator
MKTHTLVGFQALYDALEKFPKAQYLKMSAEIALSHHEKYDGSGYPNGLKGKEIPLSARIVALADVYDALVSKRAYKGAYTHEIAESIIGKDRGVHFDPMIVDAFLAHTERFIEIRRRFMPE